MIKIVLNLKFESCDCEIHYDQQYLYFEKHI